MARENIDTRSIARAASDLKAATAALEKALEHLGKAGADQSLLHGLNYVNTVIPNIAKWAERLEADVRSDLRAKANNEASPAEREVFRHRGVMPPKGKKGKT